MKVKELIEKLSVYNPDLEVGLDDYGKYGDKYANVMRVDIKRLGEQHVLWNEVNLNLVPGSLNDAIVVIS